MPNWCNNQLFFSGSEAAVKEAKALFFEMMENCIKTNEGQIPSFMDNPEQGYFFDISCYPEEEQISFNTKHSPNINDLVRVAQNWEGLDFELTYQESSNMVFGMAIYKDGVLKTYDLEQGDFARIEFIEKSDIYVLDGEESESEEEFLEDIFEQKFNISY